VSTRTINLMPELCQYILDVSLRETPVLKQLRQVTAKLPAARMQISPEQGQFMALLVQLIGARKTLEVGTFTGYSSLVVATALPANGRVVCCDINEEWTNIAKEFWQQGGVDHKITLHLAPAIETLNKLIEAGESASFDFAFIDADKANYDQYYEKALQLIRPGGLIAIDNVLWNGKVVDPNIDDEQTHAIRALNAKLKDDDRVDISLIPIGDGLSLLRKK